MSVTYTTPLQDAFDKAIAELKVMRDGKTASSRDLYDSDPDSIRELADMSLDLAKIIDSLFLEIAYQGGLTAVRCKTNAYGEVVTDAIEGNFDFDLNSRADHYTCDDDPRDNAADYLSKCQREDAA